MKNSKINNKKWAEEIKNILKTDKYKIAWERNLKSKKFDLTNKKDLTTYKEFLENIPGSEFNEKGEMSAEAKKYKQALDQGLRLSFEEWQNKKPQATGMKILNKLASWFDQFLLGPLKKFGNFFPGLKKLIDTKEEKEAYKEKNLEIQNVKQRLENFKKQEEVKKQQNKNLESWENQNDQEFQTFCTNYQELFSNNFLSNNLEQNKKNIHCVNDFEKWKGLQIKEKDKDVPITKLLDIVKTFSQDKKEPISKETWQVIIENQNRFIIDKGQILILNKEDITKSTQLTEWNDTAIMKLINPEENQEVAKMTGDNSNLEVCEGDLAWMGENSWNVTVDNIQNKPESELSSTEKKIKNLIAINKQAINNFILAISQDNIKDYIGNFKSGELLPELLERIAKNNLSFKISIEERMAGNRLKAKVSNDSKTVEIKFNGFKELNKKLEQEGFSLDANCKEI